MSVPISRRRSHAKHEGAHSFFRTLRLLILAPQVSSPQCSVTVAWDRLRNTLVIGAKETMELSRVDVRKMDWLRAALSVVAMIATIGVDSVVAEPQTIYRETFGYCSDSLGKEAADQTTWMGLVQGMPKEKVSNLKVFSYGSVDIGGSVNSNPNGLSQGYSFWFRPVYGLSIITAEFPFDAGLLKTTQARISYKQRLSGLDASLQPNKTQLAVLIDDYWYISGEAVPQVRIGIWEDVVVNPANLTYGVVPLVPGLGPTIPAAYNAPLPAAGTVRAFGLFLAEVNGRVRIDNFTISSVLPMGSTVSTAVKAPSVDACPDGSPDKTGMFTPQPTPNPDDGDSTPDYGTPDATPTPTPTAGGDSIQTIQYAFCPLKQQGTGRAIKVSGAARSKVLKKIPQTTLLNLRDRAIFFILGQRSVPLGALVNVKVGDYNMQTGVLTLSIRASAKPIRVKLRKSGQQALAQYLAAAGAPSSITAPLFISASSIGTLKDLQSAVCLSEITKMARTRSKRANVVLAGLRGSVRK